MCRKGGKVRDLVSGDDACAPAEWTSVRPLEALLGRLVNAEEFGHGPVHENSCLDNRFPPRIYSFPMRSPNGHDRQPHLPPSPVTVPPIIDEARSQIALRLSIPNSASESRPIPGSWSD